MNKLIFSLIVLCSLSLRAADKEASSNVSKSGVLDCFWSIFCRSNKPFARQTSSSYTIMKDIDSKVAQSAEGESKELAVEAEISLPIANSGRIKELENSFREIRENSCTGLDYSSALDYLTRSVYNPQYVIQEGPGLFILQQKGIVAPKDNKITEESRCVFKAMIQKSVGSKKSDY